MASPITKITELFKRATGSKAPAPDPAPDPKPEPAKPEPVAKIVS